MKKSVYSIVLMDEVVEEIDNMAYRLNTSRSNLINQILAERVSCITPEKRMSDTFEYIKAMMNSQFQIQVQASDAMLSIKSQLKFKYKPTIRYRIELMRESSDVFGKLSVSFRTQSIQLLNALTDFFKLWISLERKYIDSYFKEGVYYEYDNGRFIRNLCFTKFSKDLDSQKLGEAVGEYICMIDSMLKLFFEYLDNINQAMYNIECQYLTWLQKNNIII